MSLQPINALEIIPEESWYKIFHQVESADLQTQSRISQICKDFKRINSTVRQEKIDFHWEKMKNRFQHITSRESLPSQWIEHTKDLFCNAAGQVDINKLIYVNIFEEKFAREKEISLYAFIEKSGINVDQKILNLTRYETLLVAASKYPELIRITRYLLKNKGALPNPTQIFFSPLHIAAMYDNLHACSFLIKHGALIDAPSSVSGDTPLHGAILESDNLVLEICRALIQAGADVNKVASQTGNTPLHEAAIRAKHRGEREVYDYLLQLPNINTDILNKEGKKAAEYLPSLPSAPPPSTTESLKGSGSL